MLGISSPYTVRASLSFRDVSAARFDVVPESVQLFGLEVAFVNANEVWKVLLPAPPGIPHLAIASGCIGQVLRFRFREELKKRNKSAHLEFGIPKAVSAPGSSD